MAAKKTKAKTSDKKAAPKKTGRRISTGGATEAEAAPAADATTEDAEPEEPEADEDELEDEEAADAESEEPALPTAESKPAPKPAKLDATNAAVAGMRQARLRRQARREVPGVYDVLGGIRYTPKGGSGTVEVHASDDPDNPTTVDDLTDEDALRFLTAGVVVHHIE